MKRMLIILPLCLALAACVTTRQRDAAVTGGAIGATAGALIGAGDDNVVGGAIVGGAIGATAGAILAAPRGYDEAPPPRRHIREHDREHDYMYRQRRYHEYSDDHED